MRENIRVATPRVVITFSILFHFSLIFPLYRINPFSSLKFLSCVRMTSFCREVKNIKTYMFTGVSVHYTMLSVFFYTRYFIDILLFIFNRRYKTNTRLCNFKILLINFEILHINKCCNTCSRYWSYIIFIK